MTEDERSLIREALAGNKKLTMTEIRKATEISAKRIGFELDQMYDEGEIMKCTIKKEGSKDEVRWMLSDRGL